MENPRARESDAEQKLVLSFEKGVARVVTHDRAGLQTGPTQTQSSAGVIFCGMAL